MPSTKRTLMTAPGARKAMKGPAGITAAGAMAHIKVHKTRQAMRVARRDDVGSPTSKTRVAEAETDFLTAVKHFKTGRSPIR